jgi:hypothetical protein
MPAIVLDLQRPLWQQWLPLWGLGELQRRRELMDNKSRILQTTVMHPTLPLHPMDRLLRAGVCRRLRQGLP